ncbi:hypothetical protein MPSEU_000202600 [Mayamaea pseudoterrestris]|nr:hypothetical protein MPSEU_000202600 [Mayamaea pseudoterrestris]
MTGRVGPMICMALMEFYVLGVVSVGRSQLARATNYKSATQPGFLKILSILKRAGMIEYTSSRNSPVSLTAKGLNETPASQPPRSNAEWLSRFQHVNRCGGPKLTQICNFLNDGRQRSLADVGAAANYDDLESSGFKKVISTLVGVGIIVRVSPESVKLADIVFPFGRP